MVGDDHRDNCFSKFSSKFFGPSQLRFPNPKICPGNGLTALVRVHIAVSKIICMQRTSLQHKLWGHQLILLMRTVVILQDAMCDEHCLSTILGSETPYGQAHFTFPAFEYTMDTNQAPSISLSNASFSQQVTPRSHCTTSQSVYRHKTHIKQMFASQNEVVDPRQICCIHPPITLLM